MALAIALLLLAAEVLVATLLADGGQLPAHSPLRLAAPWLLRWAIGSATLFALLLHLRRIPLPPFTLRPRPLLLHAAAAAAFLALTPHLYQSPSALNLAAWLALGLTLLLALLYPLLPLLRQPLLIPAALAAAVACWLGDLSQHLWQPAARLTFALVERLLRLAIADPIVLSATAELGTPRFSVIIAPECSGLEGLALFLVFSLVWLVLFRDELRFPHALALVPAGLVTLYLLNTLRIFLLILLGHAGYESIAARGFHSQAGWIAFNAVAFALLLLARPRQPRASYQYPAAPYAVPFLAFLAAGLLAGAFSAGFEWLYPLRPLAIAAALYHYKNRLPRLARPEPFSLAIGLAVLALWLLADHLLPGQPPDLPPPALAEAPPALRLFWQATRLLGTAVAVPLAEELAFRGFLYRRWLQEDFEKVSWQHRSWPALIASSAIFAALHGRLWPAAFAAGLLYGYAQLRRGQIADAIAAHACTNVILSLLVLCFGLWRYW